MAWPPTYRSLLACAAALTIGVGVLVAAVSAPRYEADLARSTGRADAVVVDRISTSGRGGSESIRLAWTDENGRARESSLAVDHAYDWQMGQRVAISYHPDAPQRRVRLTGAADHGVHERVFAGWALVVVGATVLVWNLAFIVLGAASQAAHGRRCGLRCR